MKKLQEEERKKYELEKQHLENELQRNINARNKNKHRVYNNIINTKPTVIDV